MRKTSDKPFEGLQNTWWVLFKTIETAGHQVAVLLVTQEAKTRREDHSLKPVQGNSSFRHYFENTQHKKGLKPALANSSWDPISKKPFTKKKKKEKTGGEAQAR
jgi:hypothetical protein